MIPKDLRRISPEFSALELTITLHVKETVEVVMVARIKNT